MIKRTCERCVQQMSFRQKLSWSVVILQIDNGTKLANTYVAQCRVDEISIIKQKLIKESVIEKPIQQ